MEVAFSVGPKSLTVINTLKKLADNITFHTYPDIQAMIKESMLRHISFDRIVFSTVLLQDEKGNLNVEDAEGDLRELNEFIKNYSDNTSIVMITNQGKNEQEISEIFKGMFNSPMYTPVIMPTTTPKNLLELITEDITTLKTKYYVLDVGRDKTIVSSNESVEKKPETESPKVATEKKKKGGFFSGLMGGKKKSPEPVKNTEEVQQVAKEVSNQVEAVAENSEDFSSGPRSVFTGFGGDVSTDNIGGSNNSPKNLFDSENTSGSVGTGNVTDGFSDTEEDDDMLSLGDMGEQHTDTGFLDEEEEENDEELQAYLQSQQSSVEEDVVEQPEESSIPEDTYSTPVRQWQSKPSTEKVKTRVSETPVRHTTSNIQQKEVVNNKQISNIDMIIGMHGSGATSAVINEAMDLFQDKGAKVLIIDLDYKENGLLSFIDTDAFYTRGYAKGISKRRIYVEDGISILSNGYGVSVSSAELLALLRSGVVRTFDEVLIDCPIECLDIITKDILKLCNVLVFTNTDRSDLLSTSLGLTDRSVVNLDVERKIMKHCIVDCPDGRELSQEDIDYVVSTCLFANGCWLNNYER